MFISYLYLMFNWIVQIMGYFKGYKVLDLFMLVSHHKKQAF